MSGSLVQSPLKLNELLVMLEPIFGFAAAAGCPGMPTTRPLFVGFQTCLAIPTQAKCAVAGAGGGVISSPPESYLPLPLPLTLAF
jgi:hypothetical protein